MLQSRPFSYMHARPPEGKSFAAERLVHYHGATGERIDTAQVKEAIAHIQAEMAKPPHPAASLTEDELLAIGRGEMAVPDHIRAAGPIQRRGDLKARLAQLQMIAATADAHNEALDLGLSQLGRSPKADNAGGNDA